MPDEAANREKRWEVSERGQMGYSTKTILFFFFGLTLGLNACIVHGFYTWVSDNVRVSPPVPNMC